MTKKIIHSSSLAKPFIFPAALLLAVLLGLANKAVAVSWKNKQLPNSIVAKLKTSEIKPEEISIVVWDFNNKYKDPLISWHSTTARSPASVMKIVTTYAGLDVLGQTYRWRTPVYLDGQIQKNTLHGDLIIKGSGDPFLVVENLWKLLNQVKSLGIKQINGNIVLDQSLFQIPQIDPGAFDNEASRPYNVRPEALLINFKAIPMTFTPIRALKDGQLKQYVRISYDTPLKDIRTQSEMELDLTAKCGDWKQKIQPIIDQPAQISFKGKYPVSCGVQSWSIAYSQPQQYAPKIIAGLWQELGGTLSGRVKLGVVPAKLQPIFYNYSQPLTQIISYVNKYSNNVMAQQIFLTLPLKAPGVKYSDYGMAAAFLSTWWLNKFPQEPTLVADNGSGLSRSELVTSKGLALLLADAYNSKVMPEFMASLPSIGIDGTLRNKKIAVNGHLKTGSLRDVSALAGYVRGKSGRHLAFVALVNSNKAQNSQIVFDELLKWTAQQK